MSEATLSKTQREGILSKIASAIRDKIETLRVTTLEVGASLHEATPYFDLASKDGREAFNRWAVNTTGWSSSMIGNVMNAYATVQGLNKTQAKKVATWNTEALVALSSVKPENRGKVLAKIDATSPSRERVREVRDQVQGKPKGREGTDPASKTAKLAESIRERVERSVTRDGEVNEAAGLMLITGAQIAQDVSYPDSAKPCPPQKDVASAIRFVLANPKTAENDAA